MQEAFAALNPDRKNEQPGSLRCIDLLIDCLFLKHSTLSPMLKFRSMGR